VRLFAFILFASAAVAAPPLSKKAPPPMPQVTGILDFGSVSALHRAIQAWEKAAPPKKPQTEGPLLEEDGIDLLEAALAELQPRAFPEDRVDWEKIQAAAFARDKLPPATWAAKWEFIGPQNLPVPYRIYFGQGAINGRVNAVAFDPTESRTYWIGAAGGGVWRTKDAGATWQPLTDRWPMLQVSALAVIKGAKAHTVLAGTGDFPYPAMAPAMGLMRSDDGGATWRRWGPPELEHYAISRILVDPDDPKVITVSSGRGMRQWGAVWRTADGGNTWAKVIAHPAAWCELSAGTKGKGGRRWYWAIGYDGLGDRKVMRSADRGATWSQVYRAAQPFLNLCSVAASPTDPETAWVLLGGIQKVLVTRDGGASFQDVTGAIPGGYNWSQDWYDLWLAVTSVTKGGRTKDSVYVGLIDVAQMTDGEPWRAIGKTYTPGALTHNDQQSVAVDPREPAHLLLGSDGGAYHLRHDAKRDAFTFTSLNARLGITQFYHGAVHPTDPDVVLAGTQDNATPACLGDKNKWTNVGGGDGAYCAINPKQPDIQYASSQFLYIYRTGNRWRTTAMISPNWGADRRAFIAPFVLDPTDTGRLYAGTNYLWRWDDPQGRWTPRLGNQRLAALGVVNTIAVAPSDSRRLYTGSDQGELYTSGDTGATWTRIDQAEGGFPRRAITSISVHPKRPTEILVSVSGTGVPHVWRCVDTTNPRWASVSTSLPDAPANCVVRDPAAPDRRWIVGSDVGVFATEDGGASWKDGTSPLGLPGVKVNDLLLAPQQRTLTAATFGRGLWRIQLPR
jgi:photosystem II stability/assembly factor-like uncharacterized protein